MGNNESSTASKDESKNESKASKRTLDQLNDAVDELREDLRKRNQERPIKIQLPDWKETAETTAAATATFCVIMLGASVVAKLMSRTGGTAVA